MSRTINFTAYSAYCCICPRFATFWHVTPNENSRLPNQRAFENNAVSTVYEASSPLFQCSLFENTLIIPYKLVSEFIKTHDVWLIWRLRFKLVNLFTTYTPAMKFEEQQPKQAFAHKYYQMKCVGVEIIRPCTTKAFNLEEQTMLALRFNHPCVTVRLVSFCY